MPFDLHADSNRAHLYLFEKVSNMTRTGSKRSKLAKKKQSFEWKKADVADIKVDVAGIKVDVSKISNFSNLCKTYHYRMIRGKLFELDLNSISYIPASLFESTWSWTWQAWSSWPKVGDHKAATKLKEGSIRAHITNLFEMIELILEAFPWIAEIAYHCKCAYFFTCGIATSSYSFKALKGWSTPNLVVLWGPLPPTNNVLRPEVQHPPRYLLDHPGHAKVL